ncbi:MAG: hypothetical protein LUD17_04390 [Bacteroidales bacterium]|nr:hypothetical protein [Bacteroidales bacterium]
MENRLTSRFTLNRKDHFGLIFVLGILLLMPIVLGGCIGETYPASFYVFSDTPGWELAKAARANDTAKIRKLVEGGADVNYQEPVYGYTVLMTALCNLEAYFRPVKISTIGALVEVGADPNLYSNSKFGLNAVLIACQENNPDALAFLLEHGGDPNSSSRREDVPRYKGRKENALTAAVGTFNNPDDIMALEMLIKAGADLDAKDPDSLTAVSFCLQRKRYKPLLLLLKSGASYSDSIPSMNYRDSLGRPDANTILQSLREAMGPLDREDYKYKRGVIEFLKKKGLDYDTVPIPDIVVKRAKERYPDSWEHYLEVY